MTLTRFNSYFNVFSKTKRFQLFESRPGYDFEDSLNINIDGKNIERQVVRKPKCSLSKILVICLTGIDKRDTKACRYDL